jgi:hypothetical protein
MDNQPGIDRSLLFPILIAGFSVVGIIVVLLIGRALNSPPDVPVTPSATRFQFLFLGTEPAITTPTLEGSEVVTTGEPTEETGVITPVFVSPTSPSGSTVSTPVILTPPTSIQTLAGGTQPTDTPIRLGTATATLSSPVAANTYDDTDSRLAYSGNWVPRTNVSGAYQGTLHVSETVGNLVTFTFTGQDIQLFYQPGESLGMITITFDNDALAIPFTQTQSNGVWAYTLETAGTHTITIRHTSGGSVNIDKLVIPAATPTPTRSPTPTQ